MTPKTLHPCHTPAIAPLNVKSPQTHRGWHRRPRLGHPQTSWLYLAWPELGPGPQGNSHKAGREASQAPQPADGVGGVGTQSPLGVTLQPIISKSTSEGTVTVPVFLFLAYVT